MKNIDLKKIIVVPLLIIISLGLLIGLYSATNKMAENNQKKRDVKLYQDVLPATVDFEIVDLSSVDNKTVNKAVKALDRQKQTVGFILYGQMQNTFGSIGIIVGVDASGKITGAQFSILDQSLLVDATRLNLQQYIGANLGTTKSKNDANIISGATYSLDTLNDLMTDMKTVFDLINDAVADPMIDEFGEGYQIVKDESFVPTTHVIEKYDVKVNDESKGYRYVMQVEAPYSGEKGKGLVTIVMTYNLEGKIILFETGTPYEHTTGDGHRPRIRAFLTSLQETNVSDLEANVVANKGITSGSTETYTAVSKMILGFVAEILNGGTQDE